MAHTTQTHKTHFDDIVGILGLKQKFRVIGHQNGGHFFFKCVDSGGKAAGGGSRETEKFAELSNRRQIAETNISQKICTVVIKWLQ